MHFRNADSKDEDQKYLVDHLTVANREVEFLLFDLSFEPPTEVHLVVSQGS